MALNSFAAAASGQNTFTRKFGSAGTSVEPYLGGYQFIKWAKIPRLDAITSSGDSMPIISVAKGPAPTGIASEYEMASLLESLAHQVTVPGKTLTAMEFQGLGGITWTAPQSVHQDTTLSIRYLELSGIPVHSINRAWIRMIRDMRTGTTNSLEGPGGSATAYSKNNYAGSLYFWTTKPDGLTVEYSALYTGVYPKVDNANLFSGDIADNNQLMLDIDYAFDYCWEQAWVHEVCTAFAAQRKATAIATVYGDYPDSNL